VDDEDNSEIIRWTPDGTGFTIFNRKRFETEIIPKYFEGSHAKYSSFTRRLHRWNFIQRAEGHGVSNFYHEMFKKGNRELACRIAPESRTEAEDTSANVNMSGIKSNTALLNQLLDSYGCLYTGIPKSVFFSLPLGMNPSHYAIPAPIVEGLVQKYPELCNYVTPVAMNQIDSQFPPMSQASSVNHPTNQSRQNPFSKMPSVQRQHTMTPHIPGSFAMTPPQDALSANRWQSLSSDQSKHQPFTATSVLQYIDTTTQRAGPQQTAPPRGSNPMIGLNIPSSSATDPRGSSTGSRSLTTSGYKTEPSETDNRSNQQIKEE
jgi:hypothetical protein